jgi:hypothetical protein
MWPELRVDTVGPGTREFDSGDLREHVDANRRYADMQADSGPGQLVAGDAVELRAEALQRGKHAPCVVGGRLDPNVKVVGCPRAAVRTQRVGAND